MDQLLSLIRGTSLSNVVLAGFTLLVLHIVWSAIYNIFFHPLSHFPAPLSCKVSRIPLWVASIGGNQVYFVKKIHDKYGSAVRISPNELSFTDGQAWKDIYGYQKGRPENLKTPALQFEMSRKDEQDSERIFVVVDEDKSTASASILTAGTAEHARVRRLFSPAFSDRSLKQQEPLFQQYTDMLITKLAATDGRPVDMTTMFNLTTFDIMAELCFGESLHLLDNSKYSSWVHNVIVSVKALPIVFMIRYYPLLSAFFDFLEPKFSRENREAAIKHSADRVDKRLDEGSDKPDFWSFIEEEGGTEKIRRKDAHANATVFMVAGSETTASLMAGFLYLLLMNPDKLDLLKKEVRGLAATPAGLTLEALAGSTYLNACIQEALRVYPPAPSGIPRDIAASAEGGLLVAGRWVPSGAAASVHPYAAHHAPANFRDPGRFAPERWLGDARYAGDDREACQPFSYGPRNCLGRSVAWHEMRLVLATLVARFDVELCAESRRWMPGKVYFVWEKTPLMVRLQAVEA